jgi:mRNA interferase MazF
LAFARRGFGVAKFVKGDIVVIPFPFSDLSNSKRRPALVLADLHGNDYIMAQITSQNVYDNISVEITQNDISDGLLQIVSNVRPNKLFTADKNIIIYKICSLKKSKLDIVINEIINILKK